MAKRLPENRLKEIVRSHGVRAVGREANYSPAMLSRWINGHRRMYFEDVIKIARAVGCRFELVVGESAQQQEGTK